MKSPDFMPYDWQLDKDPLTDNLIITAWCLNRESEPCYVKIMNYRTFAHLELPAIVDGKPCDWSSHKIGLLMDYIHFCSNEKSPTSYSVVEKIPLYYYRGNKKNKYLILYFKNTDDMFYLYRLFKKQPRTIRGVGTIQFNMWETEISPIRKFMSCKEAEYTQWFTLDRFEETPDNEKLSTVKEYSCKWSDFRPTANSVSQSWKVKPTMLAIDIETYSPNHKAMPISTYVDHVVYMISCIFYRLYEPESVKRYAIVMGNCNDIPGSTVIKTNDEVELIRAMEKIIHDTDPDIITGYNHMNYDYSYLHTRLSKKMRAWGINGRLRNVPSKMEENYGGAKFKLYNLTMPGRINIDLYPIMQQSHTNYALYTLNYVSMELLGKSKHDIKAEEMFKIYEQNRRAVTPDEISTATANMTRVMEYCIQDSVLVVDLFQKDNVWIDLVQRSSILGVTIFDVFTKGQQIKCVSQIYHECFRNSIVMDHAENEKYSYEGGYVGEPIKGLHENIICLDFASMYPSIMQAENISYETLVADDYEISDDQCNVYAVTSKDIFEDDAPDPDADPDEEDESEGGTKLSKKAKEELRKLKVYNFKFVKSSVKEGIIPKIVRRLVAERKAIRAEQKGDIDKFVYDTLERRQIAIKVAANSVYGFLAAYKLPLIKGAMAITWMGRKQIGMVNEYLLKNYERATIVYNDTDSVMVDLDIKDPIECLEKGKKLAGEITALFPRPCALEFEKAMRILNLMKKKYAYLKISKDGKFEMKKNKDGTMETKIERKGIMTARRDNSKWMRDTYDECLISILYKKPLLDTLSIVNKSIIDLFENNIDIADLSIIKKLGVKYKSESAEMKVFSDELRKRGKIVEPGDRLQFVRIKNEEVLAGKKMWLLEEFSSEHKIDTIYYLGRIQNSIEQLLTIGYLADFNTMSHITYQPLGRRKAVDIRWTIKVIGRIHEDYPMMPIRKVVERYVQSLNIPRVRLVMRTVLE
jgi:DNA polymerase delta subunit 1